MKFTLGDEGLELPQNRYTLFIGKPAADTRDNLIGPVRTYNGEQHIMEHARTVIRALGKTEHREIKRVARFDLKHARRMRARDNAFMAFA